MKKTLFLAAMAVSAATSVAQELKEIVYTVSGKVPESVNMVYIHNDGDRQPFDSVQVRNGAFEYKNACPENTVLMVVSGEEGLRFFCDKTPVTVDFAQKTIAGSEMNNKFNKYQLETLTLNDKILAVYSKLMELMKAGGVAQVDGNPSELEEEMSRLEKEYNSRVLEIINENRDNFIPTAFLGDIVYELSFDQLKDLLNESAPYYNSPTRGVKKAKRVLAGMEKRQPGTMFIDLEIPGIDGKVCKLSEWCGKGNYVMIDFWASWCGPCRMEMPNVVANYEKYHSKGFEVVGISFDNKAEAWKKAVVDLGMKWPQLSNLKGWQSAGAAEYGIMSIPASILLDGEGRIVAIDLRGDVLGNKLREIYGF